MRRSPLEVTATVTRPPSSKAPVAPPHATRTTRGSVPLLRNVSR